MPAKTEAWVCNLNPGAALDALGELAQASLKRHEILMGVVFIPKSLRPGWFRCFSRLLICTFLLLTVILNNGPPICMKGSQLVSIYLS